MPETTQFNLDMTIAEAMRAHPRAREVFAAFRLGGCAHCAMSQMETLGQLCEAYGLDAEQLLDALEKAAQDADGES